MPTGKRLTSAQRQQIITLRQPPHNCSYNEIAARTGRPYNTVAGACRDAHLQHHPAHSITIIRDPSNLYRLGPTQLNQADLSYMLILADLPDGFTFTIGSHTITTQHGIYIRDDGWYSPPNKGSALIWHPPAAALAGKSEGAE